MNWVEAMDKCFCVDISRIDFHIASNTFSQGKSQVKYVIDGQDNQKSVEGTGVQILGS